MPASVAEPERARVGVIGHALVLPTPTGPAPAVAGCAPEDTAGAPRGAGTRSSRAAPRLLLLARMTDRDVGLEVLGVLAGELSMPQSQLSPDHDLVADLGLDSLAAVRVLAAVEERFGVELIGTDYVAVRRVGDLIAFVQRRLGAP
jgi:acyl carrier protein